MYGCVVWISACPRQVLDRARRCTARGEQRAKTVVQDVGAVFGETGAPRNPTRQIKDHLPTSMATHRAGRARVRISACAEIAGSIVSKVLRAAALRTTGRRRVHATGSTRRSGDDRHRRCVQTRQGGLMRQGEFAQRIATNSTVGERTCLERESRFGARFCRLAAVSQNW